jgi:hypothetical protein
VAAAFWSLRLGRRASATADICTALRRLPHPVVHTDSVVLLAALHLPVGELDALEPFTDPTARDPHDTLGRAHALSASAVVARRRGDTGAAEYDKLGVRSRAQVARLLPVALERAEQRAER